MCTVKNYSISIELQNVHKGMSQPDLSQLNKSIDLYFAVSA